MTLNVVFQESTNTVETVLEMLETILPTLTDNYQKVSPMGSSQRAHKALYELHNQPKATENTEQLMVIIACKMLRISFVFMCVLIPN